MLRSFPVAALAAAATLAFAARAQEAAPADQHHEQAAPEHPQSEHGEAAPAEATHGEAAHGEEHHAAAGEHAEHHGEGHEHHHSPWELRLSLETPLYTHVTSDTEGSRSTNIGHTFELGASAALAYTAIPHVATIDFEVTTSELFSSELEEGTPKGTGLTLRLGGTYRPLQEIPAYIAVMTTYHLDPFVFGLRGGVGVYHLFPQYGFGLVLEADVDFPVAGSGDTFPGAFNQQQIVIAGGVLFHL
jgi:hypothetical protein